jgi:hypothetical protein
VSENKVLRKKYGTKDEVNGKFRISHTSEVHNLFKYLAKIVQRLLWGNLLKVATWKN